jgi:hypothetical protein
MDQLGDITFRDAARVILRYRPYIATVAAFLLIATLLPGRHKTTATPSEALSIRSGEAVPGADGPQLAAGEAAQAPGSAVTAPGAPGAGRSAGTATGPSGRGSQSVGAVTPAEAGALGPGCDPVTGRVRIPTLNAVQCVPPFSGDNGGATAQGVTRDKIKVVAVIAREDPGTATILRAAGIYNSPDEMMATTRDYTEMFQAYYETYGRKIDLVRLDPSGTDEASGRADAIKVATEIKAFAAMDNVLGQGGVYNRAFATELAARKITCLCTVGQRLNFYLQNAPYLFSQFFSSDETYMILAEYIGKRLWNRKARWAGDALYQTQNRKLGFTYADTADGQAKPVVDFFEQELAKYGAKLTSRVAYIDATQDARTVVSRLKSDGVTTVMIGNTPAITTALFTQEATRQAYFPEWIVSGGAGRNDTAVFGRTSDQAQWQHAFGISELWVRAAPALHDEYRLHQWHFGRGPTASGLYRGIYDRPWMLLTGIHLAGPNLTGQSFRDGLFKFRYRQSQGLMTIRYSLGKGIKPWDDYIMYDGLVEVWWDPNTAGPDEYNNTAPGIYRFVDGGKRYGIGEWPTEEPHVFDSARAAGILPDFPAEDRPPGPYTPKKP